MTGVALSPPREVGDAEDVLLWGGVCRVCAVCVGACCGYSMWRDHTLVAACVSEIHHQKTSIGKPPSENQPPYEHVPLSRRQRLCQRARVYKGVLRARRALFDAFAQQWFA